MNINIEFKPSGELQPIIIESNDKSEAIKIAQALSASPVTESIQVKQDSEVIWQWAYEPPF